MKGRGYTKRVAWGRLQKGRRYRVDVDLTVHIGKLVERNGDSVVMKTDRFDRVTVFRSSEPQFYRR
jgi:hypothetical protein